MLMPCLGLAPPVPDPGAPDPGVPAPVAPFRWPRQWLEREPLLEAQHDRLGALLMAMVEDHLPPTSPQATAFGASLAASVDPMLEAVAQDLSCWHWLWRLRLHLRLEERWLAEGHCLCPGHRAAHRQALSTAVEGYRQSRGDRSSRLAWLRDLQAWFDDHRCGVDARAYALARSSSQP